MSFHKLPHCLVSTIYNFLPDAASRHALASTSKDIRAAVLHNISKLTVPKQQLLSCNSGSNNNPLFSFPKDALLRTLVIEGHAGFAGHDDGPQLLELLLPQPQDAFKTVLSRIMHLRMLELKDVSIGLEVHASKLGCLLSVLPTLHVLRLKSFRSPFPGHFILALIPDNEASSIRELHLECASSCNPPPALLALSAMTGLQALSFSHSDCSVEGQPSLVPLSSLQQLKHLDVAGSYWMSLPDLLEQLPRLESLRSWHWPTYPGLVAALPQSLTALHCIGCRGDDYTQALDGLRLMREAVYAQRLPYLRKLTLDQVSFEPKDDDGAWTSTPWVDVARLLAQSMSIPGVDVAVKRANLGDFDAFAVFCSLVPSVAAHIEYIEMTSEPRGSSFVPLADACPNLSGLSIQDAQPIGDLAWLYQALTLFKGLHKVELSNFPYVSTWPGELEGCELPSMLRASADATRRMQPLEFQCSFTMDSRAYDDPAFEQQVTSEVRALEECVKASCATIIEPQKRINFKASVDIEPPPYDFYEFGDEVLDIE